MSAEKAKESYASIAGSSSGVAAPLESSVSDMETNEIAETFADNKTPQTSMTSESHRQSAGRTPAGEVDRNGDDKRKKRKINGDQTTTEQLLAQLLDKFDGMDSKFNDIVCRLDLSLSQIEQNKEEIKEVKEKQEGVIFELKAMSDQLKEQKEENKKLQERLTDLTARGMRNTLVFQGFPEGAENGDCEKLIKSFSKSHLEIDTEIIIERAHRSGSGSTARPMMVAFNRYATKYQIITNARRLLKSKPFVFKGAKYPIYVDEMLPKEIREKRKNLMSLRKKLKEENPSRMVYFKYPARLCYKEGKNGKEVEYKKK